MTMFRRGTKKIHFVGIGGAGISGMARILLQLGYSISGSDVAESEQTRKLAGEGVRIYAGHSEENIEGVDLVVFSSAISPQNPELRFARKKSIPCITRSQALSSMMQQKTGIAVAGTHGKTTTTAIISLILKEAGLQPTVLVGGEVDAVWGNACAGKGNYFVAEADESDGTFLELSPELAVVTNIEDDHLDYYGDFESLLGAFAAFSDAVFSRNGTVFFSDHPNNVKLLKAGKWKKAVTYGVGESCTVRGEDVVTEFAKSKFSVFYKTKRLGRIELNLPGTYNIYNALAACSIAITADVKFEVMKDVLSGFRGTERRFQIRGEEGGVLVIEDYAHHPTEIEFVLDACKKSGRRVVAIFQPHRYSRTLELAENFGKAFGNADELIVTDIYPAGEIPAENISSQIIVDQVKKRGNIPVHYIPDMQDVIAAMAGIVKNRDLVVILGAGDINKLVQPVLDSLTSL